ncbi:alpha/beta hydrolase [Microbulbifer harenosus]|uniref:Alpha/beta hydrolase n=1 Tax=Microbulbifer harenosus TaxID=2576840 RepID=A0ABY2UPX8_9GAMM|nr:alpha/beta hydrolase [Microbulbifer harenosus]
MESLVNPPSTSLALIPGYMLDETLWNTFKNYLPEGWSTADASLGDGQTIREIAANIADRLPLRFVLVGFSLGGYVARQLAADFPERVDALIIVASSLRDDTEQQKKVKRQALQAISAKSFKGLSNTTIAQSLHPRLAADTEKIAFIKAMSQRLGYSALVTQSQLERKDVPASSIRCPTLVIASADDALRSREEAEELVAAIPGAELQVIDDSGHMIPLEQPRVLAETIVHWLSGKHVS